VDDEDRDLLQKLSRVGNVLGDVVAGILQDTISRDEQIGFVYWLADAAEPCVLVRFGLLATSSREVPSKAAATHEPAHLPRRPWASHGS
jgi:hypothetical protein